MAGHSKHQIEQATERGLDQARDAGDRSGGWLATVISALALIFSGYSFYETVWRAPDLAIYVPAQIQYSDPSRGPFEVFVIPLTIANDGARTGTILAIDLEVRNLKTNEVKRFYASDFGPWRQTPRTVFSPISLVGRQSKSVTVQFVPRRGEAVQRILNQEGGDYAFKLTLRTAEASLGAVLDKLPGARSTSAAPLEFKMRSAALDYRFFNGPGTMEMWSPDYRPVSSVKPASEKGADKSE